MATSTDTDRRATPRLGVFAGNAEITRVIGRGRRPFERARILNWSRGGLCLRVPSPRRRLLVLRQEPVLFLEDAVTCTLRLPPLYADIEVDADVVRVGRCEDDPDQLEVGLRFDAATPTDRVEVLARVLEPRRRTSARVEAADAPRRSKRLARAASGRLPEAAPKAARHETQRLARTASARLERAPRSGDEVPLEAAPERKSERRAKASTPSQRLNLDQSDTTLKLRSGAKSGRLR